MFTEDQLLPISALQHLRFCERRAALVHIERLWAENRFTVEGNHLHATAHDPRRGETRPGVRIVRGMSLRSSQLGLFGKADVVEFHEDEDGSHEPSSATIVEYKRGRPKPQFDREFHLQLCAQALCLEEMLPGVPVSASIYYGQIRRRVTIDLNPNLRTEALGSIRHLHDLIRAGNTPPARYQRKCDRCSMKNLCLPKAMRSKATAASYLMQVIRGVRGADVPDEIWK